MPFDYTATPLRVPGEIAEAHRRAWDRIAAPGTWWSGAERVAIAAEARAAAACRLCADRKAALSPAAAPGAHDGTGRLPEAAVEVAHRLRADPGRLGRSWFDALRGRLQPGPYVEIVGTVVSLVSIDAFHRAIGLALELLPEPRSGAPSRHRPEGLRDEGAWVPMLPMTGRGTGPAEADLYADGPLPNVIRAMSLVPDEVRGLRDLAAVHYFPVRQVADIRLGKTLSRAQIELVAGRVSAANECFY